MEEHASKPGAAAPVDRNCSAFLGCEARGVTMSIHLRWVEVMAAKRDVRRCAETTGPRAE